MPEVTHARHSRIGAVQRVGGRQMPDKDAAQTAPDERPGAVGLRASLHQVYDLYRSSLLNVQYRRVSVTLLAPPPTPAGTAQTTRQAVARTAHQLPGDENVVPTGAATRGTIVE